MICVEDAVRSVKESAESMHAARTERIGSPSLGDVVRQGDIYLVCVDSLPNGKPSSDRQLAPGNTQGSRHVLLGDCKIVTGVDVSAYPSTQAVSKIHPALIGPAFECIGNVTLTHPEHGDKILPEITVWQVIYQQVHAEEVRRVRD